MRTLVVQVEFVLSIFLGEYPGFGSNFVGRTPSSKHGANPALPPDVCPAWRAA
jgi:hypothetical protein